MARVWIARIGDASASKAFCESVTLMDWHAEANLEVVKNCEVDGCRSGYHGSYASIKHSLILLKDEHIVAPINVDPIC